LTISGHLTRYFLFYLFLRSYGVRFSLYVIQNSNKVLRPCDTYSTSEPSLLHETIHRFDKIRTTKRVGHLLVKTPSLSAKRYTG